MFSNFILLLRRFKIYSHGLRNRRIKTHSHCNLYIQFYAIATLSKIFCNKKYVFLKIEYVLFFHCLLTTFSTSTIEDFVTYLFFFLFTSVSRKECERNGKQLFQLIHIFLFWTPYKVYNDFADRLFHQFSLCYFLLYSKFPFPNKTINILKKLRTFPCKSEIVHRPEVSESNVSAYTQTEYFFFF